VPVGRSAENQADRYGHEQKYYHYTEVPNSAPKMNGIYI